MVDFKGELTGNSRKFLLKKQSKLQVVVFLLSLIVVFPMILALSARFTMSIIWCYLGISAFILILASLPSDKKSQKTFMPIRVYVDLKDEVIVHECETRERFHEIDTVKVVYDYGEWYYIKFYFCSRDPYFVCQKDLLTEGTLDEFEALFSDKIVRKTKKKTGEGSVSSNDNQQN